MKNKHFIEVSNICPTTTLNAIGNVHIIRIRIMTPCYIIIKISLNQKWVKIILPSKTDGFN